MTKARCNNRVRWDGGVMAWRLVQGMCYKIWVSCFASRPVREVPLYQISMARK